MPTGVDEATWRRAKRAAGKDAPPKLVMYIYQKMTNDDTEKSKIGDPGSAADDRHQRQPAKPSERRTGSKKNRPGTATAARSGSIKLSAATMTSLENKAKEHNDKHGDTKGKRVTVRALAAVWRRGAGAFSVSHRPGMTRAQWAMARVNHFLRLVRTGRPADPKYITDNDLLPSGHRRATKKSMSETVGAYEMTKTERLIGGDGDGLSPEDVDAEQLAMGVKHEMEHTDDEAIAQEIALDHLAEDPKYYTKLKLVVKSQSFSPPQAVRNNAKRGLELRRKHGRGGLDTKQASEQGIGSGVQRASDLASGDSVSLRTVKRMHAFFSRHAQHKDSRKPDGTPGAGMIAWLLWGGDAGRRWAAGIVRRMEKSRLPAGSRFGMTIPEVTPGEHVPGQIPQLLERYKNREPEPQFVIKTDVPVSPKDVAKGIVEDMLADRIATVIARAARTATHELEFRRSISAWIDDQGEALTRKQGRAIQMRSARWWRKEAEAGNLRSVNQSREQARRVGNWPDNPKFMFKSAPRGVPRIRVPHKLPLRGRELPSKTALSTRRALPAGSIRIHRSTSRGGFVRAEKQPDGTWKILGKVKSPEKHEDHKNGVPHLPAHKEHKDSPEHHKTPHHGDGAPHEWKWK